MKGFLFTGIAFLISIVMVVGANYVLLASQAHEAGYSKVMLIDRIGAVALDFERAAAKDRNNALSDYILDYSQMTCTQMLATPPDFTPFLDSLVDDFNEVLAGEGVKVELGTVALTRAVTGDEACVVTFTLHLTAVVKDSDGTVQKTVTIVSNKLLQKTPAGAVSITDIETGGQDYP